MIFNAEKRVTPRHESGSAAARERMRKALLQEKRALNVGTRFKFCRQDCNNKKEKAG